ncbi:unnamed protein product [Adineta ricciae]|uniref:Uncharacterized protein n=1 Tax=Adineta ricciae TaxID=249248 RepID=A0A816GJG6_ADIRI|nr:unnamed protein product [Adineta ricciae]
MDFAQNFALTSQREVQSAHFDKAQVTLFTVSVTFGSDLQRVKQIAPSVQMINYITDGGPGHFKNRFNILNLSFHQTDFNIHAVWAFSATSHGKGPVDGLGSVLKSTGTRFMMRHGPEEAFKSAKEFYEFSARRQKLSKSPIELLYAESKDILKGETHM